MELFKTSQDLCDVVSLIIHCSDDKTSVITAEADNKYWIPCTKIQNDCWNVTAQKMIHEIFSTDVPAEPMRVYKVWIPDHTTPSLYHVVFNVPCNSELKNKANQATGKYKGKLSWVTSGELESLNTDELLVAPDIVQLMKLASTKDTLYKNASMATHPEGSDFTIEKDLISNQDCLVEITEHQVLVLSGNSPHHDLIKSAGYDRPAQSVIYRRFLLLCFPALFMNRKVFDRFLSDCGWGRTFVPGVFHAADVYNRGALAYKDFLYILAASDNITQHGGSAAELRCRYIFRYFVQDDSQKMSPPMFRKMVEFIRRYRRQSIDGGSITREVEIHIKALGIGINDSLALSEFLKAVGDLKLRGTSVLLRCPHNYASLLHQSQYVSKTIPHEPIVLYSEKDLTVYSATVVPAELSKQFQKMSSSSLGSQASGYSTRSRSSMAPTRSSHSTGMADIGYAVHSVRLRKFGTIINVEKLVDMEVCISPSATLSLKMPPTRAVTQSVEAFNTESAPSELINGLRYFVTPIQDVHTDDDDTPTITPKEAYSWGEVDSTAFAKCLIKVCTIVQQLFKEEPRMLQLHSPVYVMGDLHGNLPDLLGFERVLWHLGPGLSPSTLLFLGDYVDRGPYGVEVVAYLFAYKVQSPTKVRLLRGNHEVRDIQMMFTFMTECTTKFGPVLGEEVWIAVNNAFDSMPLAATIDGKEFCCHGGIPPPWMCPVMAAINTIPNTLDKPDEQSPLAWELLWNDPINQSTASEIIKLELAATEGFAPNARRGTAHVFNQTALDRFLTTNRLAHVIRAHEVTQTGIQIQFAGKLITVFTSSHYCGGSNEAACVLVDRKIRVIRVDAK